MPDDVSRFCPRCGHPRVAQGDFCPSCGARMRASEGSTPEPTRMPGAPTPPAPDDVFTRMIPSKNVPALIGYYFGVFSVLPCFPLGFTALVLGVAGLVKAAREPAVKGKVHAWTAVVLGGIFGLLWLAMTILAIVGIFSGSPR